MSKIPMKERSFLRLKKRRKTLRILLATSEIIAFLLILALILPALFRERVREDVEISQIQAALEQVTDPSESEKMKAPGTASDLYRIYRVDASSLEGFYLRLPASNMDVTEQVFLIAKTPEEAAKYREQLDARLGSRKKDFESYGTEQMKYLDRAVVLQKGKYVFLIISPEAEEKKQAILEVMTK